MPFFFFFLITPHPPSLFALLRHGVFLVLSLLGARQLFWYRQLLFLLLLLPAGGALLQQLIFRVGVDLQGLVLGDGEGTCQRGRSRLYLERLVELDGHAQSEEEQVRVGVLGAECLVGQFETGGAVHCTVHTGNLHTNGRREKYQYVLLEHNVRTIAV